MSGEELYTEVYTSTSNCSREDIQQCAEKATKGMVDISQHVVSIMQERASQTADVSASKANNIRWGREALQNPRDYTQSIFGSVEYVWDNIPPLSWLGYGIAALNVVPVTILIGFLISTLAFVLTVSGTGILLAEGFFLGIGLLFLIPALIILTFSAITTGFFTVFGWSVYKGVTYILRRVGFLKNKVRFDEKEYWETP